jgi:hypothetical protein
MDRDIVRAQQQELEYKAEHYAQSHLAPEDRGRLGTRSQRLAHHLRLILSRQRGKRSSD